MIEIPAGLNIQQTEKAAADWLAAHWETLSAIEAPQVLLTGGWPFFCVAKVAHDKGIRSAFIDAGAVPHDFLPDEALPSQRELRRIRFTELPMFTAVFPISRFIAESQTLRERGHDRGMTTVLLAADHLEQPMFDVPQKGIGADVALSHVEQARAAGYKLIFSLGRYEATGYKNSPAVFDIFTQIHARIPTSRLLLLAREGEADIPAALQASVISLGFVSDATLMQIMQDCDLGISTSLWEGFNLPIAEMQWCGKPVLAFAIGAHPEIIAHPWFLCASSREMAMKAETILSSGVPAAVDFQNRLDAFRSRFCWSRPLDDYVRLIEALPSAAEGEIDPTFMPVHHLVLFDCTNASRDPANPGVIRVARRLAARLPTKEEFLLLFVRWSEPRQCYVTLDEEGAHTLGSYNGPSDPLPFICATEENVDEITRMWRSAETPVLLIPEVVLDGRAPERIIWARARGLKIAALLHDLIPITHAPFCARDVVMKFPEYVDALASCDAIWANSHASMAELETYAHRHGLALPPDRSAIWLPGQFAAYPRVTSVRQLDSTIPITALCVGSIEPRKNHKALIEGFRKLREWKPDVELRLVLVGNRFGGAEDLADWIEKIAREDKSIVWTGLTPDADIVRMFGEASFSVYASMVEGYGLPIMESLWLGCPCLCHNDGVMAELAADGGCMTVNMADSEEIAKGLQVLAFDAEVRTALAEQAVQRKIPDWSDYAGEIANRIRSLGTRQ